MNNTFRKDVKIIQKGNGVIRYTDYKGIKIDINTRFNDKVEYYKDFTAKSGFDYKT